ncbi:hypothetical protein LX36DRAFT_745564 [Colletotrichum falcatum]|nr:hypothetical protein LX36DRAFT_745564 [Colletotrichum falcatum]
MLFSTSPIPNVGQATRQESASPPFLEAFPDSRSQITVKRYRPWYKPEEKPTRLYPVGEPRPLPPAKLRYIEGIPVLPLEPPPKTAGHPKRTARPPPRRKPKSPVQPPSRLQYAEGLPVLPVPPKADADIASVARQPPVCFRDHTRGGCIHCALTASPCTFTRVPPSMPCGRCGRLGLICMIRRPGTATQVVTGAKAGDWVPVQQAVEEAVGENGARALAERSMRESEEEGTRAVFGGRFGAKDVRAWCLPRVVGGGEGGDGFWGRVLGKKGEDGEDKETEGVDGRSEPEAFAMRGEGNGS